MREQVGPRWNALVMAVGTRLVIAPLVVAVLTALLGFSGVEQHALVVQLAMPTAVNAAVVAAEFGGDADFVGGAVVVSTLASVATMTVLLSVMGRG
jgi:predicted permease